MKRWSLQLFTCCIAIVYAVTSYGQSMDTIDFIERPFIFDKSNLTTKNELPQIVSKTDIQHFAIELENNALNNLIGALQNYREEEQLSDWLYYQLIRHVSQSISPKTDNYHRYTLYKWLLMNKSGYDARVAIGNNQIIFYIRNQEDIRDIPFFTIDNKQYTCLNVHDYGRLFQNEGAYVPVKVYFPESNKDFSYKITAMPELKPDSYFDKKLDFQYNNKVYNFNIKVNEELEDIFKNYPGVDFESYFNIPLTEITYQSLIPVLKDNVKNLSKEKGVEYLMRFTRYAFLYEDDEFNFGKQVRLSPGQTLMNTYSDCDDRAALFFYLVKEIYNLPMVAILFPTHITMAVELEKPIGESIPYQGKYYTIFEPTPQEISLGIGELAEKNRKQKYEIVYHYQPR